MFKNVTLGTISIVACGCWHTGSFMFHLLEKRIAEAFAARIESLYGVDGPGADRAAQAAVVRRDFACRRRFNWRGS